MSSHAWHNYSIKSKLASLVLKIPGVTDNNPYSSWMSSPTGWLSHVPDNRPYILYFLCPLLQLKTCISSKCLLTGSSVIWMCYIVKSHITLLQELLTFTHFLTWKFQFLYYQYLRSSKHRWNALKHLKLFCILRMPYRIARHWGASMTSRSLIQKYRTSLCSDRWKAEKQGDDLKYSFCENLILGQPALLTMTFL